MKFHSLPWTEENLQLLDTYQAALPHSQFMQSSTWAAFQQARGKRVALLSAETGKQIAFAIRQPLFSNRAYWYLSRVAWEGGLGEAIADLDPRAVFIRFDPVNPINDKKLIKTIDVQPNRTLLLALNVSEENILNQMHQKTRYNIRLAGKKNLAIKTGKEHLKPFFALLEETRRRDNFRLHGREYYRAMVDSGAVKLVTIWHQDEMLAGSLVASFGDTVTYVHGASSSRRRGLMAPYALHWHCIKTACAAGYRWYDWHGLDERKWPGVTRFKKGFGGEEYVYPGTFDAPLASRAYAGYTVLRRFRRLFSFL